MGLRNIIRKWLGVVDTIKPVLCEKHDLKMTNLGTWMKCTKCSYTTSGKSVEQMLTEYFASHQSYLYQRLSDLEQNVRELQQQYINEQEKLLKPIEQVEKVDTILNIERTFSNLIVDDK